VRECPRLGRAAALLAAALAAGACAREPQLVVLRGETMGTHWSVKAVPAPDAPAPAALDAEIRALFERLDAALSNWDPDSELSRWNRSAGREWTPLSGELYAVLRASAAVNAWSEGAFDVTVAPLVDLWGFGPAGPREAPPGADELAAARARVGAALLELREAPPAARKRRPDVSVDLSAIAVGHATDRVAELLEAHGIGRYLVDVGGELRAAGEGPAGGPWRIAVQRPDAPEGRAQRLLPLAGAAVATSGDYRRFYERDGRRYAHAIDPRTGEPVRHSLASVTVVAPTAAEADAAATTLLVLGPGAGLRVALARGLPALLVARAEGGFSERMTPAFAALLGDGGARGDAVPHQASPAASFAILLALVAGVFALAAGGLGLGALAGRGPLRRSCRPVACGACRRPCPRRAHSAAPAAEEVAR